MADYSIPTDREIAEKAKTYILADFTRYESVADIASEIGTSIFTLKRVFKKFNGMSVSVFSRQQRIEKAKELLLSTNYTLQTIAEMVGYTERSNFQVAFREVVGCLPAVYRNNRDERG